MKNFVRIMVVITLTVNLHADWKSSGTSEQPTGGNDSDNFGQSVSIGSTYKVVGAPNDLRGAVYVYRKVDGDWQQISKISTPSGTEMVDCEGILGDCLINRFGYSVSLAESSSFLNDNPNLLVIGAPESYSSHQISGTAYRGAFCTYKIEGDSVTQLGKCQMGDFGNLGYSLDVSNYATALYNPFTGMYTPISYAHLAVGSPERERDGNYHQGQVDFYDFNATSENWGTRNTATVQTAEYDARFGHSVAIYENQVVIGAPNADNDKGFVSIHHSNGAHRQTIYNFAGEFVAASKFGQSVDIYKNYFIASLNLIGIDTPKGVVDIYEKTDSTWNLSGGVGSNATDDLDDGYGSSVAINNNYIAVGAPTNTYNDGYQGGGVFMYELTVNDVGNEVWNLTTELNSLDHSLFGHSVALYNDELFVGAPGAGVQETKNYEYYEPVKTSPAIIMYLLN